MLRAAHFYHIINQDTEVARVLVTLDDLGTPENKPTPNIIQQNPTNYMTFQTQRETKHRPPKRK